jgi:hypothetical protein
MRLRFSSDRDAGESHRAGKKQDQAATARVMRPARTAYAFLSVSLSNAVPQ